MKKLFVTLITTCLFASIPLAADYIRPDSVSEEIWNDLSPYFLPEEMPVKAKLDKLFAARPTRSHAQLKLAGFKFHRSSNPLRVTVARHPKIKGFLVKLHTDDSIMQGEWVDFKRRIIGALYIKKVVEELEYTHIFKIPKKWIYPLPPEPAGMVRSPTRNEFILVVENMKILKPLRNETWWRSVAMTPEKVEAIYTVFEKVGLVDSVFPDNLPFCKDRKLAFVDTQHYWTWPVPYVRLLPYFSPEMQSYWLTLTQ